MSRLVCTFQQVMSRTAPVCAFLIILYGFFCCDINFHMTISHLPVPTMRLNLIVSPVFKTVLQVATWASASSVTRIGNGHSDLS